MWDFSDVLNAGNAIEQVARLDPVENPVICEFLKNWEKGLEYFVIQYDPPKWKAALSEWKRIDAEIYKSLKQALNKQPITQWNAFGSFSKGVLTIDLRKPPGKDVKKVLTKMASAFDMAYKRFEDLQKAEAQAREAQIEAALERVRARAMALHHSEELKEVIAIIYEQLSALGLEIYDANIVIEDEETRDITFWGSGLGGIEMPPKFTVPYLDRKIVQKLYYWDRSNQFHYYHLKGREFQTYWNILLKESEYKNAPKEYLDEAIGVKHVHLSHVSIKHGMLEVASGQRFSEDQIQILKQFGSVVDLTYTRFVDLQKAESQAREAKIEVALERIRARTMAMHKSDELTEIALVLWEQLGDLQLADIEGCAIHVYTDYGLDSMYAFPETDDAKSKMMVGKRKHTHLPSFIKRIQREKKDPEIFFSMSPKQIEEFYEYISPEFAVLAKKFRKSNLKELYMFAVPFINGFIGSHVLKPIREESKSVVKRITSVFDLAYRRFLDLEKAEKQAREAQIEVALERVRARTMAMHRSSELAEVSTVLYQELTQLGIWDFVNCGFVEIDEEEKKQYGWTTMPDGSLAEGFNLPLLGDPVMDNRYKAFKKQVPAFHQSVGGKELKDHMKFVYKTLQSDSIREMTQTHFPDPTYFYCFNFSHGYLHIITGNNISDDHEKVLIRFSKAFEQTYTRFLDLKKAEAQAREAQIEAALERIRARALAMHSSEELTDVATVLREQMKELNQPELAGCVIHLYPEEGDTFDSWYAFKPNNQKKLVAGTVKIPKNATALVRKWLKHYYSEKQEYTIKTSGKELQDWLKIRNTIVGAKFFKGRGRKTGYYHFSDFSGGTLCTSASVEPSEEVKDLQKRAAAVFDLAYRRYLDLQQAEEREKEAIKQSSLDRVRAEIASMRTTEDLNRITPLIWQELTALGVPFFRCGVFIVDDSTQYVRSFLSTPTGESLAAIDMKFDSNSLAKATVKSWREMKVHKEVWNKEHFISWTKSLMDEGLIKNAKRYQHGDEAPDRLVLHLIPFAQGMLYVGSSRDLTEAQIEVAQALAEAFSVAYYRYQDFRQLENAKEKVEGTLTELRSAQDQLVHSEKMASLGELTAGIAHEIQNPLNFVNNFSDINKELADELLTEIESGNEAEARAIVEDIINNEDKIHHHGKRAEEIVRSMLLHSRGSSGEKELTDINMLADEYMRLSYHGMRAKDKSFNADFKLDLDEGLPKIQVVQQDIGRVLLNLINNAFYATNEKAKKLDKGPEYKPTVTLTTRKDKDFIEIALKDNGSGIPKNVVDKIFQPFFSTKPTGQGTGLGLSLSFDIITKGHGGKIDVKSKVGKGTEFIIKLPIE
jgi:signal transduction histidine kinase